MTVNELALQMIRENSESTDDTDKIALVEGWVSDAVSEIGDLSEWKFFQKEYPLTTVASTGVYQLPDEVIDIKYIRFTDNDEEIEYYDPERLVNVAIDLELVSRPMWWWFETADTTDPDVPLKIRLHPIPDAIYTLQAPYYFHPGTLASSSIIPIPRDKMGVIREYVRAQLLFDDKEYDGYDRRMARFQAKVIQAINSERKKHAREMVLQERDIPKRTGSRWVRFPSNYA